MYAVVMFLYTVMAAVEAVFEESLFQALNVINLVNVSVRKR